MQLHVASAQICIQYSIDFIPHCMNVLFVDVDIENQFHVADTEGACTSTISTSTRIPSFCPLSAIQTTICLNNTATTSDWQFRTTVFDRVLLHVSMQNCRHSTVYKATCDTVNYNLSLDKKSRLHLSDWEATNCNVLVHDM